MGNKQTLSQLKAAYRKRRRQVAKSRRERVQAGNCAFCGKPRHEFRFLCDECADKHRGRQRERADRIREAMADE